MRGQYKFYHWSITVYTGLSLVNFIVCNNLVPLYAVSNTEPQEDRGAAANILTM